ncbi:MAG: PAS domain S-box protein [Verrucomicrobia bacterium]|nr:PAS domain S-box protein [Verrucomicrobiota bacterium]
MTAWEWDLSTDTLQYADNLAHLTGSRDPTPYSTLATMLENVHPDDRDRVTEIVARARTGQARFEGDYRVRMADGSWRWFFGKGGEISNEGGRRTISGVSIDITNRKRTETALRARDEIFSAIVEVASYSITLIDGATGGFVEFNRTAHESLGYTREEFARLTIRDIQAEHSPEQIQANLDTTRRTGILSFDTRHRHRDGNIRDVRVSTRQLRFQERDYMAAVWEDVTDYRRTERTLRESLLFRRQAERIGRVGAWKTNPVTDELVWTEGVREIIEVPPDYQPGLEEGLKFYDRESVPALKAAVQEALKNGTPFALEVGVTTATGRHLWVEVRGLGRIEDGGTSYVMGTFHEITERRRAEQLLAEKNQAIEASLGELRTSRNMLEQIIESIPVRVFWKDATSRYLGSNRLFAQDAGCGTPQELIGKDDRDLVWREFAADYRQDDRQVMDSRRPKYGIIEELRTAEGEVIWLNTSKVPLIQPDGTTCGVLGIYEDITARRSAENALREERQRLESIIKGANVGTWEWNVQTGETRFNERWAEIVGHTLAELGPTSIETWTRFAHPEDLRVSGELLQRHFRGELPYYDCEARMQHKNGSWVWVLDRGRVTTWTPDGKPLWMQGTHTDITARKQAEIAIQRQVDELRRWHEATLGRETRVLELKREVNEVLVANGRPPRYASVTGPGSDRVHPAAASSRHPFPRT